MNCLPYGYEKGSTSGNEKYFDFFSSFCPVLVPCPVPFLPIRIRLRADALELGGWFFSCCGVCVYVCVRVCVFEKG